MFWPRTNPYHFVGRDGAGLLEDPLPTRPGRNTRRRTLRRAAEEPVVGEGPGPFGALTPLVLARLNDTQGRREARLLTLGDLVKVVAAVRAGAPWHFMDGADGLSWNFHQCQTTLALAARVDGRVYLGVCTCPAYRATPGRAWEVLQPWGVGKPATLEQKLRTWVEFRRWYGLIRVG